MSELRVEPVCSARGCHALAAWALRWNNPRLHAVDRRKTWMACAEHRVSLGDFLTSRGFLREVVPAAAPPDGQQEPTESSPGAAS
jgi:hypothetical protein